MDTPLRLTIVIPIFNEAENIVLLSNKLESAIEKINPEFWEVIFVNDGSIDGSTEILNDLVTTRNRFRVIHFDKNYGQTAAFDCGIRSAAGEWIVTMDGDLQNNPDDISLLITHRKEGIGCVAGYREKRQDSWLRRISSSIANTIRNKLSNDNIRDTGCSLKLFRKEAFNHIKLFEGMHRFLPTLIRMEGYDVVQVPVSHYPRHRGTSKYGVWNRVFKSFLDLLAVRWMKKRMLTYRIKKTV
ncbi:MAG: glycosyltransferase family 2 protein [Desulfobacterales bacterium]|nr:glycosyltransferase family 2 protein [Desulfobacterales bacterium]